MSMSVCLSVCLVAGGWLVGCKSLVGATVQRRLHMHRHTQTVQTVHTVISTFLMT